MTDHYFENEIVVLHYYKFGNGPKNMLCFHGYGMHGKQFHILEETLGSKYTFFGFDLFFHKGTKLVDQSVSEVKKGISKEALATLFLEFCAHAGVHDFSIISYSMGSHYAATLVEVMPEKINEFIVAAPSFLRPGKIINFLSRNKLGNRVLEKMALSERGMTDFLATLKKIRIVDQKTHDVLLREVETSELRFSFFACIVYMRNLKVDAKKFIAQLNQHQIKSVFVFGARDKNYPQRIGRTIIPKIELAQQLVLNENHYMINKNFAGSLNQFLNDN